MKTTLSPETLTALIDRLTDHVVAECNAVDVEARFDQAFDESHETPDWLSGTPSSLLRETDPTGYRCAVADMIGTDDTLNEIRGEYYDERDVENARESFVDELREIETGLEMDEDANLDPEVGTEGTIAEQLAKVRAEIEACENHPF